MSSQPATAAAGHDFELGAVDDGQKRSFWSMFVIMMGFTFFSASMWVGLTLANGLTASRFFWAVMAGNLILGAYTGLLAYPAAKTGLSVHLLSRYSFGVFGSDIPSTVLAVTQIGWFGVGVAMFSIPTTVWLNDASFIQGTWFAAGPDVSPWGVTAPLHAHLLWSITIAAGVAMTSSAYFGIKALHVISIVAVPAIAVLGGWSAIQALFFDKPDFILAHNPTLAATLAESGKTIKSGWDALAGHVPGVDPKTGASLAIGMVSAISLGIGSLVSGGSCTPDFTRFAKNAKIAVSTTVLAFFIGNSLMFFFGGAAAMVYDKNDISEVLKIQGLLVPAVVVLLLNIWTTNDNALYTSGLGLSNITRLPKRYMVLLNGAVGTLAGLWLYDNFCGWLNILNTFIPPCGAILITDFFVLNKCRYPKMSEKKFVPVSAAAVAAWALGSVVALAGFNKFCLGDLVPFLMKGIPAINGMLVAAVVYCALSPMERKRARSDRAGRLRLSFVDNEDLLTFVDNCICIPHRGEIVHKLQLFTTVHKRKYKSAARHPIALQTGRRTPVRRPIFICGQ